MALRDNSRLISLILWLFVGGLFGLAALGMFIAGVVSWVGDGSFAVPGIVMSFVVLLVGIFIVSFSGLLMRLVSSFGVRGEQLARLHAMFGGKKLLPGPLLVGRNPQVYSRFQGVELRILVLRRQNTAMGYALSKAFETPHARLGSGLWGGRLHLQFHLDTPTPIRVAFGSRTRLSHLGTGGLTEVPLPPGLSERLVCFSDAPDRVLRLFQTRPDTLDTLVRLIDANYPYVTAVSFSSRMALWRGPFSKKLSDQELQLVPARLLWLARQFGWSPSASPPQPYR